MLRKSPYSAVLLTLFCMPTALSAAPLRVYILAGQSNMQGHAQVRTFPHLGMDPQTAPLLAKMQTAGGNPRTHTQVWISSIGHDGGVEERHGLLSADYGAAGRDPKIGPEYTFGIFMHEAVEGPILLIKTAWGGKSLHTDFRPPSAGPYVFNAQQLENLKRQGKDVSQVQSQRAEATGKYYRLMLEHIRAVLSNLKRVFPEYDPEEGYQLAGFVWFQGWNDMVDRGVYPQRDQPGGYDQYADALAHFIRDVRRDLNVPQLPFVIGVMGAGGPVADYGPAQRRYAGIHTHFRDAMAAPAKLPEFHGNVRAVLTERYWDGQLGELAARFNQVNGKRRELAKDATLSRADRDQALEAFVNELYTPAERRVLEVGKSNAEYHYLGSAKIMAQIGKAFAEAMIALEMPTTR